MQMKLIILFLSAACLMACQRVSKVEQYKAEKHYRDSISLIDQQRSLRFYQSQLDSLAPQADSLLEFFEYEKQEKYQDKGFYIFRSQQSSKNPNRCYLQSTVRDDGQAVVKCFYYGDYKVDMKRVVLSAGETEMSFAGTVHMFEQHGWHGIITLEDSVADQALRFVDAFRQDRIYVRYTNGEKKGYRFYLSDQEKECMCRAYHLSIVIRDINELEKRIYKTSRQIEMYQKRLQS